MGRAIMAVDELRDVINERESAHACMRARVVVEG